MTDDLIILDDWNSVVKETPEREIISKYGLRNRNQLGERIIFCERSFFFL